MTFNGTSSLFKDIWKSNFPYSSCDWNFDCKALNFYRFKDSKLFIDIAGYNPDDVKVFVENGEIQVQSNSESELYGKNLNLSINIPENLENSGIKLISKDRGQIVISFEVPEFVEARKELKLEPEFLND